MANIVYVFIYVYIRTLKKTYTVNSIDRFYVPSPRDHSDGLHIYIHIYIYIYMNIFANLFSHTYIYIGVYVCVCVCPCLWCNRHVIGNGLGDASSNPGRG